MQNLEQLGNINNPHIVFTEKYVYFIGGDFGSHDFGFSPNSIIFRSKIKEDLEISKAEKYKHKLPYIVFINRLIHRENKIYLFCGNGLSKSQCNIVLTATIDENCELSEFS